MWLPDDTEIALGMTLLELHYILQVFGPSRRWGMGELGELAT